MAGAVTAAAVAAAVAPFSPWQLTVTLAWDVMAVTYVVMVAAQLRPEGPRGKVADSFISVADDTHAIAGALLLAAVLASLVAVGFGLTKARQIGGVPAAILTITSVSAIASGWVVVHLHAAVHYGRLYLDERAIDFGTDEPTFWDFAYLAFTVGMTYQVSDTAVTGGRTRRAVLVHALISFAFGVVIIASAINVVGSLLGR